MYTLYTSHGACSTSVHFLLEELGVPYEAKLVSLKDGEQFKPEYLALNPRSRVPALIVEGTAITEASSIITFLCDRHLEKKLMPPQGTLARARATQWLAYIASGIHPHWTRNFRAERFGSNVEEIKKNAVEMWQKEWDHVEDELAKRGPFTCGADVQAPDFYLFTLCRWGRTVSPSTLDRPHVKKHFESTLTRPAVQRVMAATGLS